MHSSLTCKDTVATMCLTRYVVCSRHMICVSSLLCGCSYQSIPEGNWYYSVWCCISCAPVISMSLVCMLDRFAMPCLAEPVSVSADLSVTPRKAAGDEHISNSASRNSRNNPKSTSTGSLMGAVRAAAGRKSKKEFRRSGDGGRDAAPGARVSASGQRP